MHMVTGPCMHMAGSSLGVSESQIILQCVPDNIESIQVMKMI